MVNLTLYPLVYNLLTIVYSVRYARSETRRGLSQKRNMKS